jgi:hypothetical protein
MLACGFRSGAVRVFDIHTATMKHEMNQRKGEVKCVSYATGDADILLATCADGMLVQYNVARDYVPTRLVRTGNPFHQPMAVSPDGRTVCLAVPQPGAATLLAADSDMAQLTAIASLTAVSGNLSHVTSLAFTADGLSVLMAMEEDRIVQFDVATCSLVGSLSVSSPRAMDISANSKYVAIAGKDHRLHVALLPLGRGSKADAFGGGHNADVRGVRFTNDSNGVVTVSEDSSAIVWRFEGDKSIALPRATSFGLPNMANLKGGEVRFNPSSKEVFSSEQLVDSSSAMSGSASVVAPQPAAVPGAAMPGPLQQQGHQQGHQRGHQQEQRGQGHQQGQGPPAFSTSAPAGLATAHAAGSTILANAATLNQQKLSSTAMEQASSSISQAANSFVSGSGGGPFDDSAAAQNHPRGADERSSATAAALLQQGGGGAGAAASAAAASLIASPLPQLAPEINPFPGPYKAYGQHGGSSAFAVSRPHADTLLPELVNAAAEGECGLALHRMLGLGNAHHNPHDIVLWKANEGKVAYACGRTVIIEDISSGAQVIKAGPLCIPFLTPLCIPCLSTGPPAGARALCVYHGNGLLSFGHCVRFGCGCRERPLLRLRGWEVLHSPLALGAEAQPSRRCGR